MGTPHVHCMSQLPTAHEPADRQALPVLWDTKTATTVARIAPAMRNHRVRSRNRRSPFVF